MNNLENNLKEAAEIIQKSKRTTAFTGAGISVESGIPPFRGPDGLWNKFNPEFIEINYFFNNPLASWKLIKEIFYDFFGEAKPNAAHTALAQMEKQNLLHTIITQNIDNLHTDAGSKNVYEFHGNSRDLICTKCSKIYSSKTTDFNRLPPLCQCGNLLKPDFVFFGEPIPEPANSRSFDEANKSDLFIIIGTTGEIMPASMIPYQAKQNGKTVIEINIEPSAYTHSTTDIFLQGKATKVMTSLLELL